MTCGGGRVAAPGEGTPQAGDGELRWPGAPQSERDEAEAGERGCVWGDHGCGSDAFLRAPRSGGGGGL